MEASGKKKVLISQDNVCIPDKGTQSKRANSINLYTTTDEVNVATKDQFNNLKSPKVESEPGITAYNCKRCKELFHENMENLLLYNDMLTSFALDVRELKAAVKVVTEKWQRDSELKDELAKDLNMKLMERNDMLVDLNKVCESLRQQIEVLQGTKKKNKRGFWRLFSCTK